MARNDSNTSVSNECERKLGSTHSLKIHKSFQSKEEKSTGHQLGKTLFKCEICKKSCSTLRYLKKHLLSHTDEYPYACDECDKKYKEKYTLEFHIDTVHCKGKLGDIGFYSGKKIFKCEVCNKIFRAACYLRRHRTIHSDEKRHNCEECDKNFSSKYSLEFHNNSRHFKNKSSDSVFHSGKKLFKCDLCQKAFLTKSYLKRHSLTHTGEKPYACDECEKKFRYKYYLEFHMDTMHCKEKLGEIGWYSGRKLYKCDLCPIVCRSDSHLKVHVLKHTLKDPNLMRESSQERKCRSDDDQNIGCLSNKKVLKCETCEKVFYYSNHLKNHLLKHSGEKPYACDECDYRFVSKYNLERHKVNSHPIKEPGGYSPYSKRKLLQCPACDKYFVDNSVYKKHLMTHTGEKPYECEDCDRKYNDVSYLKQHRKTVHSKS